jgi:hypothetical protein
LLGTFDVTSSPTGAYAVTSKFTIYRYFLNLEVVEEKEKFRWSSFFLLYDFETSPK